MVLRITEKGEALVRELLPSMWRPLKEMMRDFPESEQRQMLTLLKRMGGLMDEAAVIPKEQTA
jgi:hypothetical protein